MQKPFKYFPKKWESGEFNTYKQILSELPIGAVVTYRGPSVFLSGKKFRKYKDRGKTMGVKLGSKHYFLRYENLVNDELLEAERVREVLLHSESSLPF